MRLELHFPEINFLREWWQSRMSRVRALESEVRRLKSELEFARSRTSHAVGELKSGREGAAYWAQKATTSITWNVILWHVRQRVTAKYRESDRLARFVDKPTEDEALEVLREMWRKPPVFAPPEECRELAAQIVGLNTRKAAR